jgi:hypothetical protein
MTLWCYVHDLDDGQQIRPDHQEHIGSGSFVVVPAGRSATSCPVKELGAHSARESWASRMIVSNACLNFGWR